MRANEILRQQRTRPFRAIRIHLSDGACYDVRHPEMMTVTTAIVFIARPPEKDGVPDRSVYCDPVHVTRIEPIDGETPDES